MPPARCPDPLGPLPTDVYRYKRGVRVVVPLPPPRPSVKKSKKSRKSKAAESSAWNYMAGARPGWNWSTTSTISSARRRSSSDAALDQMEMARADD